MPVYEFRCAGCGKRFELLIGMTQDSASDRCPNCNSPQIERLVSRVARFRTEDGRIEEMADRIEAMGEPTSESEMRQVAREMGKALDDDMADDMEEMFEADMEAGPDDLD